ncbi:MAG TPA: GntR family transcriptional regulator [Ktedonobacterales bacterium]|nr:GntR family transcriptional regulator [Ktedonobacterales bacterium]
MIAFYLDGQSGVPPYLQIAQQVKEAMRLGLLTVGDQLPTVREVVEQVVIHPNTVFKAYHELEHEGLVVSRPGHGTFVIRTLPATSLASHASLRRGLERWLARAREVGLDDESVLALVHAALRAAQQGQHEDLA